ncbi:hypothetical protein OROMI_009242 [Orobanche minor]
MARDQSESSLCDSSEHSWQATLGFFGLPDDPSDVINGLIQRDGRIRAEQLHLILRQRKRGCLVAYEMLQKFRTICVGGYCAFGCHGSCTHNKQIDRALNNIFLLKKLREEAALRLVDPSLRTSENRPINIFINSYSPLPPIIENAIDLEYKLNVPRSNFFPQPKDPLLNVDLNNPAISLQD